MTRILTTTIGDVSPAHVKDSIETIRRVYEVCKEEAPDAVEVIFYSSRSLYSAYMRKEAERLGVRWGGGLEFIAYHDAWTGIPRIHVITEVLARLPLTMRRSTLIHEAAHTILHGNIGSYLLALPGPLLTLNIEADIKWQFLHIISTGIKDYDVTIYVARRHLDSSLSEYILYNLRLGDEDLLASALLGASREAAMIASASLLKSLAQASAAKTVGLLDSERIVEEAGRLANVYPRPVRDAAWNVAFHVLPRIKGDLQDKIEGVVRTMLLKLEL